MRENYSPGVLSVLPLFYVGWADSVLGPSEQKLILDKIDNMPHLSESDKNLLKSLTDQNNPPSEEIFKNWSLSLKQFKDDWAGAQKDSLINLGILMAQKSNVKGDYSQNPKVFNALRDLEFVLGVDEPLNSNILEQTLQGSTTDYIQKSPFTSTQIVDFLYGKNLPLMNKITALISDPFFHNSEEQRRNKDDYRNRILDQAMKLAEHEVSYHPFPSNFGGNDNSSDTTVVFESLAFGDISLSLIHI